MVNLCAQIPCAAPTEPRVPEEFLACSEQSFAPASAPYEISAPKLDQVDISASL